MAWIKRDGVDRMFKMYGVTFRCDSGTEALEPCGCNVFRWVCKNEGHERLRCNACGALYIAERESDAEE